MMMQIILCYKIHISAKHNLLKMCSLLLYFIKLYCKAWAYLDKFYSKSVFGYQLAVIPSSFLYSSFSFCQPPSALQKLPDGTISICDFVWLDPIVFLAKDTFDSFLRFTCWRLFHSQYLMWKRKEQEERREERGILQETQLFPNRSWNVAILHFYVPVNCHFLQCITILVLG